MRRRSLSLRLLFAALLALPALCLATFPASAADTVRPLAERVTPEIFARIFPGADRMGAPEGAPEAITVFKGDEIAGYLFSTLDVVKAPGYSGVPFDVIGGVDVNGVITGAVAIYHKEAYVMGNSLREAELAELLTHLAGATQTRVGPDERRPDFIKSATVTGRTMRAAVVDAARFVLRARSGRPVVTEPTLDRDGFVVKTWAELQAENAVAIGSITNAEVAARLAAAGGGTLEVPPAGGPDDVYSEIYATLATPLGIGTNILGNNRYKSLFTGPPTLDTRIMVVSYGRYNFVGIKYQRAAEGNRFDRFRIRQGERTFTFVRDDFLRFIPSGTLIPRGDYGGLLTMAAGGGFDPLQPWTFELLINATGADGQPLQIAVPATFTLPPAYILMPEPDPPPAWLAAWQDGRLDITILCVALAVLTGILAFQSRITRYRRTFATVRTAFLLFTLVWLGWMVGGQLSTIHLINYATAPIHGYDLAFFLAEPIIVIIALYTAVSLVLLGRGVFCGWLCPFGAMQELLAKVARFLRLPQWNPSEAAHRKLWWGKYATALFVIVVAIAVPEKGSTAAEIEPFKTAITSMFDRAWPFELYAILILGAGLFTERAYCRFLCPLGGILALGDRLHLVDLLKRREECGTPCQLCAHACPVKAIEKSGKIKMAECFQCLDCQVEYYDDHRCPPLVKARKQAVRVTVRPVPLAARIALPIARPAE